jgi:hypothetical protein
MNPAGGSPISFCSGGISNERAKPWAIGHNFLNQILSIL